MKRMNPINANLSVPCAFLTPSGLPSEVKYLNAPIMNIINKAKIMNPDDIKIIFPNTTSKHFNVGTSPSTTQSPHGLIAAYTGEGIRNKE